MQSDRRLRRTRLGPADEKGGHREAGSDENCRRHRHRVPRCAKYLLRAPYPIPTRPRAGPLAIAKHRESLRRRSWSRGCVIAWSACLWRWRRRSADRLRGPGHALAARRFLDYENRTAAAGETGHEPAPKEQPPRKLSGKRTAWHRRFRRVTAGHPAVRRRRKRFRRNDPPVPKLSGS